MKVLEIGLKEVMMEVEVEMKMVMVMVTEVWV